MHAKPVVNICVVVVQGVVLTNHGSYWAMRGHVVLISSNNVIAPITIIVSVVAVVVVAAFMNMEAANAGDDMYLACLQNARDAYVAAYANHTE